MNFTCKRCFLTFQVETDRESICMNCKAQLNLLNKELRINDKRIKKLQDHTKLEAENPSSKDPKTHLETVERLEYNLQLEYRKRDGIIKTINSKDLF